MSYFNIFIVIVVLVIKTIFVVFLLLFNLINYVYFQLNLEIVQVTQHYIIIIKNNIITLIFKHKTKRKTRVNKNTLNKTSVYRKIFDKTQKFAKQSWRDKMLVTFYGHACRFNAFKCQKFNISTTNSSGSEFK